MELPFPVASSGGLLLRGTSSGMPDQRQMLGFFHVPMSWRSRLKLRQQYPVYTSLLVIMITCTVLAGYATAQTPGKINTPLPQQGKNAAIDSGAPPKTRIPLTPT